MKEVVDDLGGLCPYCEHRFRRVFEPGNLDNFTNEDGSKLSDFINEDDVVVFDICLLTDIPMGNDFTNDCSHFMPMEESNDIEESVKSIYKHLK